ncbi:MAG TPA: tagatose 1,6-diphosphate aldolase [Dongiaceae bacterium]|nr:tagatose 1,6-diphosphate aldolase [Dongiaceae bacterium]
MSFRVTEGKKKRLQAVADSRGVIAALAIDQRNAIKKLFANAIGCEPNDVPGEQIVQFKEVVSQVLTPHASAILLDPEYGLPAAKRKSKKAGLLLAYEKTGYEKAVPGRLPHLLDRWSASRLVSAGADCVKLLLYYSSTSPADIVDAKHAFVERVGAECSEADVPFFLELVSYAEGLDDKGAEFAKLKPMVVAQGMAEFSQPQYRVDVLKVGMPVNLGFVEGAPITAGQTLSNRTEALAHYRAAAAAATVPFIYLSEGVSNETFLFGLELAAEAKAPFCGVLCGRATWQDGVPVFVKGGTSALEDWLSTTGTRNIENVNQCLKAAQPWFAAVGEATSKKPLRGKGKGHS